MWYEATMGPFIPLKESYRNLAFTLRPFTYQEAAYKRCSMLCCCLPGCSARRKHLLNKETIRNEALRSVQEDNLDILELLKVVRLVQQTFTDKDAIMDEQDRLARNTSPSVLIYSCLNLLNFGKMQSR